MAERINIFARLRGKTPGKGREALPALTASLSSPEGNDKNAERYRQYGLQSPPKAEDGTTEDYSIAKQQIATDGFRRYMKGKNSVKAKQLVYLYGRKFMKDSSREERRRHVKEMVCGAASDRLTEVLRADGDKDRSEECRDMTKKHFAMLQHYFAQEGAFGFCEEVGTRHIQECKYFFRFQQHGNCYLQAPGMLMAYLGQKLDLRGFKYPVDVSKYVRHNFSDYDLCKYVVEDDGGFPVIDLKHMLKSLEHFEPSVNTYGANAVWRKDFDLRGKLNEFGPGLVSNFRIFPKLHDYDPPQDKIGYVQVGGTNDRASPSFVDFSNQVSTSELENIEAILKIDTSGIEVSVDTANKIASPLKLDSDFGRTDAAPEKIHDGGRRDNHEFHSMTCIGGRCDPNKNKTWLLLQNWWDDMQFIEVSVDYFKACGGELSFVEFSEKPEESNEVSIENCYSLNRSRVAECFLNKAERPKRRLSPQRLDDDA